MSAQIGSARSCRSKPANGFTAIPEPRCSRCRMPPTNWCFAAKSRRTCAPIDLGARSFRYPVYLGDDQRNRVYDLFADLGPAAGLRVDISNDRRLGRAEWADFLNECRGTIGSEAGTWYLERDDRTALAIRDFLRARSAGPDHRGRRLAPCRRAAAALWDQGRIEGVAAALLAAA